jgi:hypothetical protein
VSLEQIWADDFSAYASQAAFEAAYPKDQPSDMATSVVSLSWGPTSGPDGGPGLSAPLITGGQFDKIVDGCLKVFRVATRLTFTRTNICFPVIFHYHVPGSGWPLGTVSDNPFQIRKTNATDLQILVRTVASGGFDPNYAVGEILNAFVLNTAFNLRVDGAISTLLETSPGVFAPDTDGYIRVYVNDVLGYEFTGKVWNGDDSFGPASSPYINRVRCEFKGHLTNFEIWDDAAVCDGGGEEPPDEDEIKPSETTPCCSGGNDSPTDPGNPGDTVGPNPYVALPAWIPACDGGGLVPTAPDLLDSENWAQ